MFLGTSVIKNNSEVVADGPISDTYHAANQYGPRRKKYFSRDHHMVIREASESLLFQAKGSNSEYYVTDKVKMSERICKFYNKGICHNKENCKYQHPTGICRMSVCTFKQCNKRHPEVCKFFMNYGFCKYNNNCLFRHNEQDLKMFKRVCKLHNKGICCKNVCKYQHPSEICKSAFCTSQQCDKRHPTTCMFYLNGGKCKYNLKCLFRHDVNERPDKKNNAMKRPLLVKNNEELISKQSKTNYL